MSERVAVTGAAGHLGRVVVAELQDHGYDVVAIDRPEWDGRSVPALVDQVDGCAALIHLAAIPAPVGHPPDEVFANNTQATFAALEAAGTVGITRCAIASSGSAYGTAWSPQPTRFRYVPVDEAHPMINYDPYGLSKEVDERTAAVLARRYTMSVAALRFHWIATRDQQLGAIAEQRSRREWNWEDELRGLWGYVDVRDAASACRLAIESAVRKAYGFVPMNIVAADALSETPLRTMLAEHAPELEVRAELGPTQGGYVIDRARDVIGWVPQHSWRDRD